MCSLKTCQEQTCCLKIHHLLPSVLSRTCIECPEYVWLEGAKIQVMRQSPIFLECSMIPPITHFPSSFIFLYQMECYLQAAMASPPESVVPFFLNFTLTPSEAASHQFSFPAPMHPAPYLIRAFVLSASDNALASANATLSVSAPAWQMQLSSPVEVSHGDTVALTVTLTCGNDVKLPADLVLHLDSNDLNGKSASDRASDESGRPAVRTRVANAGEPVDTLLMYTPTKLGMHELKVRALAEEKGDEVAIGTLKLKVVAPGGRSVLGAVASVGAGKKERLLEVPAASSGEQRSHACKFVPHLYLCHKITYCYSYPAPKITSLHLMD
jgi:hypothetical protein